MRKHCMWMWPIMMMVSLILLDTNAAAADASNGEQLSRRWCAACHVVAPDQRGTTAEAPSFAAIAKRVDFDSGKLSLFLLDPHPKMPDMGLSRAAAGDLAAYIATLK